MTNLAGKVVTVQRPDGRVVTGRCVSHRRGWVKLRFRNGQYLSVKEDRALCYKEE